MTNEELVTRIKAGIDTADNMLALWQQNHRYIHSIAKHYEGKAEIEDLEQEGYLALYAAIDGYDTESGYKFLSYATWWIRQRMMRYIQNNGTVRIPVHEDEKLREYRKIVNAFRVYLGRKPTRHEIAHNMGIPHKMVAELEKAALMGQIGSLDSYLTQDGDSCTIGDMVPCEVDIEGDVLEGVQQEQLKAVIWSCVDELPERQRDILHMRYQDGISQSAIGREKGVSHEAIRQMENKALKSLRYSKNARLLYSFLDDDIYSMGLVGNGSARFNTTWTSSTERAAILSCGNTGLK